MKIAILLVLSLWIVGLNSTSKNTGPQESVQLSELFAKKKFLIWNVAFLKLFEEIRTSEDKFLEKFRIPKDKNYISNIKNALNITFLVRWFLVMIKDAYIKENNNEAEATRVVSFSYAIFQSLSAIEPTVTGSLLEIYGDDGLVSENMTELMNIYHQLLIEFVNIMEILELNARGRPIKHDICFSYSPRNLSKFILSSTERSYIEIFAQADRKFNEFVFCFPLLNHSAPLISLGHKTAAKFYSPLGIDENAKTQTQRKISRNPNNIASQNIDKEKVTRETSVDSIKNPTLAENVENRTSKKKERKKKKKKQSAKVTNISPNTDKLIVKKEDVEPVVKSVAEQTYPVESEETNDLQQDSVNEKSVLDRIAIDNRSLGCLENFEKVVKEGDDAESIKPSSDHDNNHETNAPKYFALYHDNNHLQYIDDEGDGEKTRMFSEQCRDSNKERDYFLQDNAVQQQIVPEEIISFDHQPPESNFKPGDNLTESDVLDEEERNIEYEVQENQQNVEQNLSEKAAVINPDEYSHDFKHDKELFVEITDAENIIEQSLGDGLKNFGTESSEKDKNHEKPERLVAKIGSKTKKIKNRIPVRTIQFKQRLMRNYNKKRELPNIQSPENIINGTENYTEGYVSSSIENDVEVSIDDPNFSSGGEIEKTKSLETDFDEADKHYRRELDSIRIFKEKKIHDTKEQSPNFDGLIFYATKSFPLMSTKEKMLDFCYKLLDEYSKDNVVHFCTVKLTANEFLHILEYFLDLVFLMQELAHFAQLARDDPDSIDGITNLSIAIDKIRNYFQQIPYDDSSLLYKSKRFARRIKTELFVLEKTIEGLDEYLVKKNVRIPAIPVEKPSITYFIQTIQRCLPLNINTIWLKQSENTILKVAMKESMSRSFDRIGNRALVNTVVSQAHLLTQNSPENSFILSLLRKKKEIKIFSLSEAIDYDVKRMHRYFIWKKIKTLGKNYENILSYPSYSKEYIGLSLKKEITAENTFLANFFRLSSFYDQKLFYPKESSFDAIQTEYENERRSFIKLSEKIKSAFELPDTDQSVKNDYIDVTMAVIKEKLEKESRLRKSSSTSLEVELKKLLRHHKEGLDDFCSL